MPDNQRLNIRLSPEEKALWSRCASQRGLSLSDWIRTTLNNHVAAVQRKRLHEERQRELTPPGLRPMVLTEEDVAKLDGIMSDPDVPGAVGKHVEPADASDIRSHQRLQPKGSEPCPPTRK